MKRPVLLLDLDEVLADFSGTLPEDLKGEWTPEVMYEDNFFYNLKPVEGAMGAVKKLLDSDLFDIHICSTPVAGLHQSYSDKSAWVAKYFPTLIKKIILCQDKKMVKADIAIDDRPSLYSDDVRVIDPTTRRANQRYKWHKIAEDLIKEYKVQKYVNEEVKKDRERRMKEEPETFFAPNGHRDCTPKKRRPFKEIYKEIDEINKRKPSEEELDELAAVLNAESEEKKGGSHGCF